MAFKGAFVVMAPDADPQQHRATVNSGRAEVTVVVAPLHDFKRAAQVCRALVHDEGVQSITLCPGFTNAAVAMVAEAVGEGVPVCVSRADVPSMMAMGNILAQEGWMES